jgi:hypothetical protein
MHFRGPTPKTQRESTHAFNKFTKPKQKYKDINIKFTRSSIAQPEEEMSRIATAVKT